MTTLRPVGYTPKEYLEEVLKGLGQLTVTILAQGKEQNIEVLIGFEKDIAILDRKIKNRLRQLTTITM